MTTTTTEIPSTRHVTEITGLGPQRDQAEAELDENHIALPLPQRAYWLRATTNKDSILFLVHDGEGRIVNGTGAGVTYSRALPGHRLYRIERYLAADDPETDIALLTRIVDLARADHRCLRFSIELLDRDTSARERLEAALQSFGFTKLEVRRTYRHTLALDLAPGADALFAQLTTKARRDIRKATKCGLEVRPITDALLAPRLAQLIEETYHRTGGQAPGFPWLEIVGLSAAQPCRSRISGLFDPSTPGAESLVAFAWGALNGEYVTYEAGGSTRRSDLRATPMAYAPLWDLIAWASETPASWFDFGGVTMGTKDTEGDPLGGISDFKRYFCDSVVEVGDDWVFEPNAIKASIARAVSGVFSRI